jgi:hypothetical protein
MVLGTAGDVEGVEVQFWYRSKPGLGFARDSALSARRTRASPLLHAADRVRDSGFLYPRYFLRVSNLTADDAGFEEGRKYPLNEVE